MRYFIVITLSLVLHSCQNKQHTVLDNFQKSARQLRQVGLFESFKDLEEEKFTTEIILKAKKEYELKTDIEFNEFFDHSNPKIVDMYIAKLDETRVWWEDLEADVLNENNVYLETVKEFSKLSNGYLNPQNIQEEWETEEGPIKVSFNDGDTLRIFNLKYKEDWYDIDFFSYMKSSLAFNGATFSLYFRNDTGQDLFIIRLNEEEKRKLEKIEGWNDVLEEL